MPAPASPFASVPAGIVWRRGHETLTLTAWKSGVRVRATCNADLAPLPSALLEDDAPAGSGAVEIRAERATLRAGGVQAEIDATGRLTFTDALTGETFLREPERLGRSFRSVSGGGGLHRIEQRFESREGERFYGLGQHQHGRLDQKGCVIDLEQRNTEVTIPFLVSSARYGFLWNNPGVGRVELAGNGTRWTANASPQIDYWITRGGSDADLLSHYADATGHPPMLPAWAAGFWQSKLRYSTQDELLAVAREHRRRELPISVIVVDYFHWPAMGDWKFDPAAWPDPTGMVRELDAMGIKLMVSVWPTINAVSENFAELSARGLLVGTERGVGALTSFVDTPSDGRVYIHHYDATHPEARAFLWERVRENYVAHGITVFWLDACEPELNPFDHDNLRYHAGNGAAVGCWFPMAHQQAFHDGLTAAGETEIITLGRSAWAGSQRYGAAVWSGDIPSTFEALQAQVRAGLNMAMSGIPWWTSDIGGFHGAYVERAEFRELIVRWFQYGVFCPLCRLHGVREPSTYKSGGPNEIWHFGEPAATIIGGLLRLRERLRPYILEQMALAHERGLPPMRPLFFDFPDDPACVTVDDQFLLGPDVLVAPILHAGADARAVYLPAGTPWRDAWLGEVHQGGQWLTAAAPLETVPVYVRASRDLPFREEESGG